jgi:choline dehydrogenase-like flavoprotein
VHLAEGESPGRHVRPELHGIRLYARGNKNDYDAWAVDNPGWSYDEVLPYFIKSEVNRNPYIASNTKYHGTGGYLTVQEPAYTTPLVTAFLEGGAEMGYEIRDCNAAKQTGDYKLSILNND